MPTYHVEAFKRLPGGRWQTLLRYAVVEASNPTEAMRLAKIRDPERWDSELHDAPLPGMHTYRRADFIVGVNQVGPSTDWSGDAVHQEKKG